MTGENRNATAVVVLLVCVVLWFVFFGLGVWSAQSGVVGWAYFWAILTMIPALGAYEALRRWHRG